VNTKLSNNLTLFIILVVIGGVISIFLPSQFLTVINFASMGRQFPD